MAVTKPKKKKKHTKEQEDQAAVDFGWSVAFFKSIPELWKKFSQAIDEGWTAQRFQAEIQNTKWYRNNSDSVKKTIALQKTKPGEYKALMSQTLATVKDAAGRMGAVMSDKQLKAVATHYLWGGWNDSQLRDSLANYIAQVGKTGYDGEAGAAEDDLREYAYKMGTRVGDKQLKSWLGNILRGNRTVDAYKNWIQSESLKMFPTMADQIKGGQTVYDLASPYIQSMSSILELSPSDIDLFDPTIRRAMSSQDPDKPGGMMPLYQYETMLRNDPRWMQTNNARTQINQIGLNVLKDFGFQA